MPLTIESIEILLLIAALVAMLSQRVRLPYTIGLVAAGILIGNFGFPTAYTDKSRAFMMDFRECMAFIANAIIFFLIGVREADQSFWNAIGMVAIAVLVVTFGRAAAIYPLSLLFHKPRLEIESGYQHILFWGGLRSALALALALGLPTELEQREQIITAAFGVVAFSIFVQGLTMTPLLRRLQVLPPPSTINTNTEELADRP